MRVAVSTLVFLVGLGVGAQAQSDAAKPSPEQKQSSTTQPSSQSGAQSNSQSKPQNSQPSDNPDDIFNKPMTPPRSDAPTSEQFPFPEEQEKGSYSSSKDSQGDLSPPSGDSLHPGADIKNPNDDVLETKPWNPHEADKDVEVGTYYFKRGNYKAAEARYRDALNWQDNHAEAMYRLGATLQKESRDLEARMYYEKYLKILPKGEFAAESRKEIEKMDAEEEKKAPRKASTSPSL